MSLSYHHRPARESFPRAERGEDVQACICTRCGTDEFLVPDNLQPRPLPSGVRGWDVTYWCSQCDGFYGHLAASLPAPWKTGTT